MIPILDIISDLNTSTLSIINITPENRRSKYRTDFINFSDNALFRVLHIFGNELDTIFI